MGLIPKSVSENLHEVGKEVFVFGDGFRESLEHPVRHGEVHGGFAGVRAAFVVLGEHAIFIESAERPLDDPAEGEHLEPRGCHRSRLVRGPQRPCSPRRTTSTFHSVISVSHTTNPSW